MFAPNTLVAWATRSNTFMGVVVESGETRTVVRVTSTAKGQKHDGKTMSVCTQYLGDITTGRTEVTRIPTI